MSKATIRRDYVLEKINEARKALAKAELFVNDCKHSDLSETTDSYQQAIIENLNQSQEHSMRAKFEMYNDNDDISF